MPHLQKNDLDDDQYMPFEQGWDAFVEQHHEQRNPWVLNNWKHDDWQEGWSAAKKRSLQENYKPHH